MGTGLSIQLQSTSEAEIPVDDVVLEGGGCYSVDCACSLQFVQIIVKTEEKKLCHECDYVADYQDFVCTTFVCYINHRPQYFLHHCYRSLGKTIGLCSYLAAGFCCSCVFAPVRIDFQPFLGCETVYFPAMALHGHY